MAKRKCCPALMWLFLLLGFVPSVAAQTAVAPAKEQNIRKLLALTDARGIFKRSLEIQVDMMKTAPGEIPPEFWDEVMKEVSPDKFVDLIIPIYDKHFTNEDVVSLIAFYQTPLGQKVLITLPLIMKESEVVGAKYGEEVAAKVVQRMQAESKLPRAAPPPPKPTPTPPPPR